MSAGRSVSGPGPATPRLPRSLDAQRSHPVRQRRRPDTEKFRRTAITGHAPPRMLQRRDRIVPVQLAKLFLSDETGCMLIGRLGSQLVDDG